jgi:hypothetical protein
MKIDDHLNTSTDPEEMKRYDIKLGSLPLEESEDKEELGLRKLKLGKEHEKVFVKDFFCRDKTLELKCEYYDTGWRSGNMCIEVWNDSTAPGFQGQSGITSTRADFVTYKLLSPKSMWKEGAEDNAELQFPMVMPFFERLTLKAYLSMLIHWKTENPEDDKLKKIRYIRGGDGRRAISILVPLNIAMMTDIELITRYDEDFNKMKNLVGNKVYDPSFWDKEFHNYAVREVLKGVSKLIHTKYEKMK